MSDAPAATTTAQVLLVEGEGALAEPLATQESLRGVRLDRAFDTAEALECLQTTAYEVVVTDPATSVTAHVPFIEDVRHFDRRARVIVLAPQCSQADLIAALRMQAFVCCSAPFDAGDVAAWIGEAARSPGESDGIEVLAALPDWVSLRVSSRRITAERLVRYLTEYHADLADTVRQDMITAFREMLLNAMEHGAQFDPDKRIEVSMARTSRSVRCYLRDPGPGFSRENLAHAAVGSLDGDPMAHAVRRSELGLRPGGYGILLVSQLVDELVYNERGNEVIIVKHTGQ
jgi:anti-sigma regulatory factor (Ser/Thr protein kinase)